MNRLLIIFIMGFCSPLVNSATPTDFLSNILNPGRPNKMYLSTTQILKKYGYVYEKHKVPTSDGHILRLNRIRGKKGGPMIPDTAPTIFLMTGACSTDKHFVFNGPGKTVGLTLVDEGFDVWLGNFRGNKQAKHKWFSKTSYEYWNYGVFEAFAIDTPAMIDYILAYVKKEQLSYVGISFGGLTINYCLMFRPEYNKKIKTLYYMSPAIAPPECDAKSITTLSNMLQPYQTTLPLLSIPAVSEDYRLYDLVFFLGKNPVFMKILHEVLVNSFGPYGPNFKMEDLIDSFTLAFGSCSVSFFSELSQYNFKQNGSMYDYGHLGNRERYGDVRPPRINITSITPRKIIFYGSNDDAVPERHVWRTVKHMVNVEKVIRVEGYNHAMFTLNDDIKEKVADHIVADIKKDYSYSKA